MPNLIDIKKRINNVETIEKISQSIKGISTAKVNQLKNKILTSKEYFSVAERSFLDMVKCYKNMSSAENNNPWFNIFFENEERVSSYKEIVIFIESDKGLCGSFNNNVTKALGKHILSNMEQKVLIPIGQKSFGIANKMVKDIPLKNPISSEVSKFGYVNAELIYHIVDSLLQNKDADKITFIYTKNKSLIEQNLIIEEFNFSLFKHVLDQNKSENKEESVNDDALTVVTDEKNLSLAVLASIKQIFINHLMKVIMYSYMAENSARMQAMDAANQNSRELKSKLTLYYNRTRQSLITKELIEIISGAESLVDK